MQKGSQDVGDTPWVSMGPMETSRSAEELPSAQQPCLRTKLMSLGMQELVDLMLEWLPVNWQADPHKAHSRAACLICAGFLQAGSTTLQVRMCQRAHTAVSQHPNPKP